MTAAAGGAPHPHDQLGEELAEIGLELAVRVRDEDPEAYLRWLPARMRDRGDQWPALVIVLAAHVPVDEPADKLLAWLRSDQYADSETARWRAAHAEFQRLRYQGVSRMDMDPAVVAGELAYQAASLVERAARRSAEP